MLMRGGSDSVVLVGDTAVGRLLSMIMALPFPPTAAGAKRGTTAPPLPVIKPLLLLLAAPPMPMGVLLLLRLVMPDTVQVTGTMPEFPFPEPRGSEAPLMRGVRGLIMAEFAIT